MQELSDQITGCEIDSFRLYGEEASAEPWVASFGYTTNSFGGFLFGCPAWLRSAIAE